MSITINTTTNSITVTQEAANPLTVVSSGAQGPAGPTGATGAAGQNGTGVASGGSNGQVLIKNSAADFDTSWSFSLDGITIGANTRAAGSFTDISYSGEISFSSDARLKQQIRPLEAVLGRLLEITPVSYRRSAEGRLEMGLLAQDIKRVFPAMVGMDNQANLTLHGLDLLGVLIKAVHELDARLRLLEAK